MYADYGRMSVSELISSLTAREGRRAKHIGDSVLETVGSVRALLDASIEELSAIPGVGPATAKRIKATVELARRLACLPPETRVAVRSPGDVAALLMSEMRFLGTEHFRTLLLDSKNRVIASELVSTGTLNASLVHPRELFRRAIKASSAAVVLAHNHPSGDPTPSAEDLALTKRLVEAGRLLGIEILDHVIIGDNRYVSLKERGLI
jgi:DNA repair protein RadC